MKRKDRIFHQGVIGLRKSNIIYDYSNEELTEYAKCYNNINYFIDKYCSMKLLGFQEEILKHFEENRFTIFLSSRQTGTPRVLLLTLLHSMIFNNESVLIVEDKACEGVEKLGILKEYYKNLPFFLQKGVISWNRTSVKLDNGSYLKISSTNLQIGRNYDSYVLFDFSRYYNLDKIFQTLIPTISARVKAKLVLVSRPNGINLFTDILLNSEREEGDPLKNNFKTLRIYWWQIPGRDIEWKNKQIKELGSEDLFDQEYDMKFIIKKK